MYYWTSSINELAASNENDGQLELDFRSLVSPLASYAFPLPWAHLRLFKSNANYSNLFLCCHFNILRICGEQCLTNQVVNDFCSSFNWSFDLKMMCWVS